jgi:hypothetical protein
MLSTFAVVVRIVMVPHTYVDVWYVRADTVYIYISIRSSVFRLSFRRSALWLAF